MLLLLALLLSQLFAQGKQITGTVTASENKQPVAGVTVTVKGQKHLLPPMPRVITKSQWTDKATTLVFSSASFVSYEAAINGRT